MRRNGRTENSNPEGCNQYKKCDSKGDEDKLQSSTKASEATEDAAAESRRRGMSEYPHKALPLSEKALRAIEEGNSKLAADLHVQAFESHQALAESAMTDVNYLRGQKEELGEDFMFGQHLKEAEALADVHAKAAFAHAQAAETHGRKPQRSTDIDWRPTETIPEDFMAHTKDDPRLHSDRQRALLLALRDTLLEKLTPEVQTVNVAQPGIQLTLPKQPPTVVNVAPSPAPNVRVDPPEITVNCDMSGIAISLTQALAPILTEAMERIAEKQADTIYRGMVELGKAMIEQARILAARPTPVIPEARVQVEAPQVTFKAPKREPVSYELKHSDGTTTTLTPVVHDEDEV